MSISLATNWPVGFCHPDPEQPKVKGNYTFEPNGRHPRQICRRRARETGRELRVYDWKGEITITEKPFLLPEAVLKSTLSVVLKDFCAKFPSGE